MGDVAGPQRADHPSEREVGRRLGVPEHHVGPVVHELADVHGTVAGERYFRQRLEAERAAEWPIADGDRSARSGG